MKTKLLLVLNFFLISHLLVFAAMADQRLDIKTQTDLIQKLESVLELQNANEASDEMLANKSLTLRLADLYSERSRLLTVQLLTVQEDGKGNEKYKKLISKDQNRAIQLYRKHLPKMSPAEKARPHLQIAHLLFLQKKPSLAIQYLEETLESKPTEKIDPQYRAQAAMQLADLSFSKADFTKAEKLYTQALILTPVHNKNQKDYVSLRLAWCAFNQGKTDLAVTRMTKALEHSISVSGVENNAFAEEASKDLATFLAQRGLSAKDIWTLKKLSPKNVLQSNLIYLAHELERTAKKDQAILVWS
ncbi:MAG: tetratricopeptide repeat protein, partial [Pseudobdellovibrionaceae bacterium]